MPAASTEQQLSVLARAHQRQLLTIRDRTVATISAMWARLVTDPTDQVLDRWLAAAVPVVSAAQLATAGAAISYIGTYVAAATGAVPKRSRLVPADFLAPRGVDLTEVLTRPIVEVRTALANGDRWTAAVDAGGQRAAQFAGTDPMLSARAAGSEAMKIEPRVVGFRRVPDAGACKFCLLASTQRYHDTDLMPIHPRCGCSVAPIVGDRDPGRVLDRGLVDQLMAADPALGRRGGARGAAREAAQRSLTEANDLIAVHEHGELGPTLYGAGQKFSGL